MRPEIQQVLEMNKSGKITDEQAATLIEELMAANHATPPPPNFSTNRADFGSRAGAVTNSINQIVGSVVESVFDATTQFGGKQESDFAQNRFLHSDWTAPTGTQPVFRNNQIRMSKLRDLRLDHSELSENQIDASRLQELHLVDGKFNSSQVRASSINELKINRGEMIGMEFSTSKCSEILVSNESVLKKLQIQSSVLKEIKITEQTIWENSFLNAIVLSEVRLVRSHLADCEIQTARLLESDLTDCEWKNVLIRGATLDEVHFSSCRFDRVLFTNNERWGWKKKAYIKTRFENCAWTNVAFSNCRLDHCAIRNVSLTDFHIRDLDLAGRTIDGNEAFLAAIGPYRT